MVRSSQIARRGTLLFSFRGCPTLSQNVHMSAQTAFSACSSRILCPYTLHRMRCDPPCSCCASSRGSLSFRLYLSTRPRGRRLVRGRRIISYAPLLLQASGAPQVGLNNRHHISVQSHPYELNTTDRLYD